MSKITHHIPTESFGYTEIEMAETEFISYEEAKLLYGAYNPSQGTPGGLTNKEWLKVVEHYLNTAELLGGAETWATLSKYQCDWIQETKRAFKRLNK